jgi:DNA-dependent metalloprotease WSS1
MSRLAHCKQMNHSKAFWGVRNQYAGHMEELWGQGYTGEGLWGKGQELSSGHIHRPTVQAGEVLPEHICGGTYQTNRGRGRKRKARQDLTWKEQKERRILKKFGPNGLALGADEDAKIKLEKGKKVQAKPRVAKSQRGRELRAAAALARLEDMRKAQETPKKEEEVEVVKIESDDSEYETDISSVPDAVDIDGSRLVDKDGLGLVKVCGDEQGDEEASREMRELLSSFRPRGPKEPPKPQINTEKTGPKPRQQTLVEMLGKGKDEKTAEKDSGYVYRR